MLDVRFTVVLDPFTIMESRKPPSSTTCTARGIAATWRVAQRVADRLPQGGVVALQGELGAGKTTFVQGIARALGITRPVTSPTFTLVAEYPGERLRLVHLDLYRLRSPDDLLVIGFQEYLESGALVAIEWPDRAGDLLPTQAIWVTLTLTARADTRTITVDWEPRDRERITPGGRPPATQSNRKLPNDEPQNLEVNPAPSRLS